MAPINPPAAVLGTVNAIVAGRARQYDVRLAGSLESGWDENTFYESALLGQLAFGDFEFQKKEEAVGRKSFVTKLLTSSDPNGVMPAKAIA